MIYDGVTLVNVAVTLKGLNILFHPVLVTEQGMIGDMSQKKIKKYKYCFF